MEEGLAQFLKFVVPFVCVGLVLWLMLRWDAKKSQTAAQLASEMGYQFEAGGVSLEEKIVQSGFDVFRRGRSKSVRNLFYGPYRDSTMMICDYGYVTGQGRTRRHHWQTVILFSWGQLRFPEFTLRPQGTLGTLAAQTLNPGITFEECPEFSRRYHLTGWNETAIRQVFPPIVAKLGRYQTRLVVESSGFWLLVHKPGALIRSGDMQNFITEARDLYDRVCTGLAEFPDKAPDSPVG